MLSNVIRNLVIALVATLPCVPAIVAQAGGSKVLSTAEMEKLFPATVFYAGQSAPSQLRNSGGVKFSDGHYVLASLVDTSGYSSGVAAKYQGYFISEVQIKIEGKTLPAGAYGMGFIENDKFLITDLGGHDVLSVGSASDEEMKRPRPLQILTDPAGGFRIYSGRRFVHLTR